MISAFLLCNRQGRLKNDDLGGFIDYSNHDTSNIPNMLNLKVNSSLVSQTKCDNMFSDPSSDHILSHFLVRTWFIYFFFLYVLIIHLLQRGEGCRNIPCIDSRINRMDANTNIIFLPNIENGYITKFEIILGGVFQ